eukprot:snap_masked-scaffold_11-processed-gene-11.19-mRNA-1 protein AED:1.00 eAED:1.00 QI:0/0/0/0/1/1/2/0/229
MFPLRAKTNEVLRDEVITKFEEYGGEDIAFSQNNILLVHLSKENKKKHLERKSYFTNFLTILGDKEYQSVYLNSYERAKLILISVVKSLCVLIFVSLCCCGYCIVVTSFYQNSFKADYENVENYLRQNIILSRNGIFIYLERIESWGILKYCCFLPGVLLNYFFNEDFHFYFDEFDSMQAEQTRYLTYAALNPNLLVIKEDFKNIVYLTEEVKDLLVEKMKEAYLEEIV